MIEDSEEVKHLGDLAVTACNEGRELMLQGRLTPVHCQIVRKHLLNYANSYEKQAVERASSQDALCARLYKSIAEEWDALGRRVEHGRHF